MGASRPQYDPQDRSIPANLRRRAVDAPTRSNHDSERPESIEKEGDNDELHTERPKSILATQHILDAILANKKL